MKKLHYQLVAILFVLLSCSKNDKSINFSGTGTIIKENNEYWFVPIYYYFNRSNDDENNLPAYDRELVVNYLNSFALLEESEMHLFKYSDENKKRITDKSEIYSIINNVLLDNLDDLRDIKFSYNMNTSLSFSTNHPELNNCEYLKIHYYDSKDKYVAYTFFAPITKPSLNYYRFYDNFIEEKNLIKNSRVAVVSPCAATNYKPIEISRYDGLGIAYDQENEDLSNITIDGELLLGNEFLRLHLLLDYGTVYPNSPKNNFQSTNDAKEYVAFLQRVFEFGNKNPKLDQMDEYGLYQFAYDSLLTDYRFVNHYQPQGTFLNYFYKIQKKTAERFLNSPCFSELGFEPNTRELEVRYKKSEKSQLLSSVIWYSCLFIFLLIFVICTKIIIKRNRARLVERNYSSKKEKLISTFNDDNEMIEQLKVLQDFRKKKIILTNEYYAKFDELFQKYFSKIDEDDRKKKTAEIEANRQEKEKHLLNAFNLGVLTEEEYQRKISELKK